MCVYMKYELLQQTAQLEGLFPAKMKTSFTSLLQEGGKGH